MTTKKEYEATITELEEAAEMFENDAMDADSAVADVVDILKIHGDHTRQCAKIHGQRYYMEPVECDCGWDDIVKEYL